METDPQLVPSVVSVMVVHEPGDWFDETLASLAAQDYANFRTLFLLTERDDGRAADISARIRDVLPSAFIRTLPGTIGFGAGANEVLRLVEGDNGFFLICHDDVALAPDTVRVLVAELFRSNAGVVGPKLVDWDEPRRLQHVGLGLDRFGEVDSIIEPGEFDQEQHDAVRDVFVLPSACFLVRADLFRTLGGFDPAITFHGDDVDLCWRAHMTGARVVVVPDAVVRHREQLELRRPDLPHRTMRARHRMRVVATLTGASRLLGRSIQMVLLTMVELVVGLFTGRFGEALASLRALGGLIPRTGSIVKRRRAIAGQRIVHEREVLSLQDRGSSRLTSYLRGKETTTYVGADSTVRRWREASFGPPLAWFLVVLAIVIGSRQFIRGGVPSVGEFLPFPESPGDLLTDYRSSFDGRSFGSASPLPTGWVVMAGASVLTLFRMQALLMFSIVGGYLVGALGAWRLVTVFPLNRARIAGMVVYVGTPLVPGLLGHGDWSTIAWYAALPWLVHLVRRAAGLEPADPTVVDLDITDGIAPVGWRHRVRAIGFLSLVLGVATAFVPVVIVLWAVVGLVLGVATLIAGGSWKVAAWLSGATAISVVVAFVLNLPWSLEWMQGALWSPEASGSTGRSIADIATLGTDDQRFVVLALALYVPVIAAVAITRAWRFTWSVRAAALVVVFGAALIAVEWDVIGLDIDPMLLAPPIALGLALSASAIAGGFGTDVLARGFGWRQPVAVLANLAVIVGLAPAILAVGNGRWDAPNTTMASLLAAQLPDDPAAGDYRALYVGDPRLLPVPGRTFQPGVAYAVTDDGPLEFTDRFYVPDTRGDEAIEEALALIASGSTLRAGRLLAPLGIRYVVIPYADGANSTTADPLPLPDGLVAAFENQLDLGAIYGPPSLEIFVNQAFIPVGAQLTGASAEASRIAGEENLAQVDLEAQPSMLGVDTGPPTAANQVIPGVVHIGIPYDERITLTVDGDDVPGRPGFGVTTAFDVDAAGTGRITYDRDESRGWWTATQLTLWFVVLVVAAGARAPFVRRRSGPAHDETLIDLDEQWDDHGDTVYDRDPTGGIAGEALDPTLAIEVPDEEWLDDVPDDGPDDGPGGEPTEDRS
ncbi:GT2 family glycosyltransferase [Ilumatobacter fluminis]|uniref:GT2 family glycosyltransferase n=1 Tax=Ilumatobacter fluminis TaxID=467091 RepID=A0A4R7I416_9ACTN|nr:glycosyltransferase [Ilumatobacter fluminis]TDT17426.1 GT2 family glycosyltransferase [Ilumatobacter fluminis]